MDENPNNRKVYSPESLSVLTVHRPCCGGGNGETLSLPWMKWVGPLHPTLIPETSVTGSTPSSTVLSEETEKSKRNIEGKSTFIQVKNLGRSLNPEIFRK